MLIYLVFIENSLMIPLRTKALQVNGELLRVLLADGMSKST